MDQKIYERFESLDLHKMAVQTYPMQLINGQTPSPDDHFMPYGVAILHNINFNLSLTDSRVDTSLPAEVGT